MGISLILNLIILGIGLFSAIGYLIQRSDNKHNLKQALENNQAIRQLTEDEYLLLKPYLDDKSLVRPYKYQSSLVSYDVSVISGSCVRHSFSTNGAESTYYFVIGDIEVFLPYGMDSYTAADNIAEVVFTEQYAFVVSINGYDLATAKAECDAQGSRDEQWHTGGHGQFKTISDEDIAQLEQQEHDPDLDPLIHQAKHRRCEILAQRDETPFESERYNKSNLGILTVIFWVMATIMAIIYSDDNDSWLLIISGISAVCAIIFYFHRPKRHRGKVNRIKGTIEEQDPTIQTMLIGDSLMVSYPKHWQGILPEKTNIDNDMDIAVTEKSVLRYGHSLSISKEIEQYGPPAFWGRNCALFITGLILSGVIYVFSSSLYDDVLVSYRILTSKISSWHIMDQSMLKNATIKSGDTVDIELLGASCAVTTDYRCDQIFITDEIVDDSELGTPLPNWAEKQANGSLIVTKRDSQIEILENYERMYASMLGNTNNYNNNRQIYTKLLDVQNIVAAIDEACTTDNGTCTELKDTLLILMTDQDDKEFATWQALSDFVKQQNSLNIIVYIRSANAIENLFATLSRDIFAQRKELLKTLLQQQQASPNSLSLTILNSQSDVATPFVQSQRSLSSYKEWMNNYSAMLHGLGTVKIAGLVSAITYHEDGSVAHMTINPSYRYQFDGHHNVSVIVVNTGIFAIILLVTVLQLVIWISKMVSNKRRLQRIQADYHNLILS
ncbi:intracellular growth attenuator protein IgaA [Orbus hercynius]|uniref:Intracellular growth attenuator protein IgaA n=1 Tax=Orbus hercynius TaxID=593135 RepID=A0A495RI75_9GAMM|nr:IgaA/UmoB family intracellular growth attenuator [Orbus hercynius]RKS87125.1 intracellular growth attenuator protein IgaA [Orbus hercynius]